MAGQLFQCRNKVGYIQIYDMKKMGKARWQNLVTFDFSGHFTWVKIQMDLQCKRALKKKKKPKIIVLCWLKNRNKTRGVVCTYSVSLETINKSLVDKE